MWLSQGLIGLLIMIMATTEGFQSDNEPLQPRAFEPSINDNLLFPPRETRSGIFWTGSRYNRRGSSEGFNVKKQGKVRGDRFYMGSRYGKRSEASNFELAVDLCKYISSLYPCNSFR